MFLVLSLFALEPQLDAQNPIPSVEPGAALPTGASVPLNHATLAPQVKETRAQLCVADRP